MLREDEEQRRAHYDGVLADPPRPPPTYYATYAQGIDAAGLLQRVLMSIAHVRQRLDRIFAPPPRTSSSFSVPPQANPAHLFLTSEMMRHDKFPQCSGHVSRSRGRQETSTGNRRCPVPRGDALARPGWPSSTGPRFTARRPGAERPKRRSSPGD
jgi:hypothetical protein